MSCSVIESVGCIEYSVFWVSCGFLLTVFVFVLLLLLAAVVVVVVVVVLLCAWC